MPTAALTGRPPTRRPFPLTRALTARPAVEPFLDPLTGRPPYGKAPYGEASYGKAPSGGFLTGNTLNYITRRDGPYGKGRSLTGRAGVPYGSFTEKDDEEAYGKAGPLRKALTKRDGPFTEKDDEEAYGKAGPLREAPYEEERSLREGPEFTEAYGKLRGKTLPELGGNFRLCAVDQKRPFFP